MEDARKKLGYKAKKLRKLSQKTQREIADAIGVYPNDLSAFEKHGNKLGLDKITALFEFFGYELDVAPKKKASTLISL